MQTILLFATKAIGAIGGAGHAAASGFSSWAANGAALSTVGGASAGAHGVGALAAGGANAAKAGSSVLSALRVGTSVVSALSAFGMGNAQAEAARAEAFDEDLQARQEFTQAQERANEIQRRYNITVGDQLAAASANGVDLGSQSVGAVRERARDEADRALTINRNNARLNAAMRRGRAAALRRGSGLTQTAGALQGAAQIASAVLDVRKVK